MKLKNYILLEYQENFADNLSIIAYGKILEKNTNSRCYFENDTKKRLKFENYMSNFNLDYDFISTTRVKEIAKKAYFANSIPLINNKNKILKYNHFKINDIDLISDEIKSMIKFNHFNFVTNYDILEEIQQNQSIGLYINQNDIKEIENSNYILRATERLNKYVKKPKLYIFTDKKFENKINSYIDFKIINLPNWREEFYFLTACKHKIILNTKNSYSEGFWAAVLNQKDYYINIYNKKIKTKKKYDNWIGV